MKLTFAIGVSIYIHLAVASGIDRKYTPTNKPGKVSMHASSSLDFLPVLCIPYCIILFFLGIKNRDQRYADTYSRGHGK